MGIEGLPCLCRGIGGLHGACRGIMEIECLSSGRRRERIFLAGVGC